jgi:hypothetical protein
VSVKVSCPGCGAAVEFKYSAAIVKICEYCRSVVARGDFAAEDFGKVAALVDTETYLEVGRTGTYGGRSFVLTGRAQLRHSAGGVWDEWYACFNGDRWGWIAEAQGRFYVTFPDESGDAAVAGFDQLGLGETVSFGPKRAPLVVSEKGAATYAGAEGEIPYRLIPGASYEYADLSGPGGAFATIDYGDEKPVVFHGREVTLQDLGISPKDRRTKETRQVDGKHLSCPNCGGALELRAPDRSERVVCPNCHSLLDCSQGDLRYLQTLEASDDPLIPIGSVGRLAEGEFTVIGFLERYVCEEGINYYWQEYLLYQPGLGFRWLVRSQNHWNYVRPLSPGDVSGRGQKVTYQGRKFKLFQKGDAVVSYVMGECYWKVQIGETVSSADFINPPDMLSREIGVVGDTSLNFALGAAVAGGEINWSFGTYLPVKQVEQAFGVKSLPSPRGVAPNQAFGYKNIYMSWALLSTMLFLVAILIVALSPEKTVFNKTYEVKKDAEFTTVELKPRQNIHVTVDCGALDNCWLGVGGDFVNEETGLVQPFFLECEYYHGYESGEWWSEGQRQASTTLSALPAGTYTLRLETETQVWSNPMSGGPGQAPRTYIIEIKQGVPHWSTFFLAWFLISALPLCVLIYHLIFEQQRWKDSAYSPFRSSSDE